MSIEHSWRMGTIPSKQVEFNQQPQSLKEKSEPILPPTPNLEKSASPTALKTAQDYGKKAIEVVSKGSIAVAAGATGVALSIVPLLLAGSTFILDPQASLRDLVPKQKTDKGLVSSLLSFTAASAAFKVAKDVVSTGLMTSPKNIYEKGKVSLNKGNEAYKSWEQSQSSDEKSGKVALDSFKQAREAYKDMHNTRFATTDDKTKAEETVTKLDEKISHLEGRLKCQELEKNAFSNFEGGDVAYRKWEGDINQLDDLRKAKDNFFEARISYKELSNHPKATQEEKSNANAQITQIDSQIDSLTILLINGEESAAFKAYEKEPSKKTAKAALEKSENAKNYYQPTSGLPPDGAKTQLPLIQDRIKDLNIYLDPQKNLDKGTQSLASGNAAFQTWKDDPSKKNAEAALKDFTSAKNALSIAGDRSSYREGTTTKLAGIAPQIKTLERYLAATEKFDDGIQLIKDGKAAYETWKANKTPENGKAVLKHYKSAKEALNLAKQHPEYEKTAPEFIQELDILIDNFQSKLPKLTTATNE